MMVSFSVSLSLAIGPRLPASPFQTERDGQKLDDTVGVVTKLATA
jgi:hypothetical protein